MTDVGTRKVFENDRVIVWEMILEPGETTGIHTHAHDYFFHVLDGSTLRTVDEAGKRLGDYEFRSGSTNWLDLEGDELVFGEVRVPARHEAENIGSTRYREVLVELK